jgi:hypothetical protein
MAAHDLLVQRESVRPRTGSRSRRGAAGCSGAALDRRRRGLRAAARRLPRGWRRSPGTPIAPRFTGAIALLEDTNERPLRRIDRMLTQLRQSGMPTACAGWCSERCRSGPADEVCETIEDCLADLGVPIGFAAPVGHGPVNYAVPLGVAVRLRVATRGSAGAGALEGIEPLVS